MPTLSAIVITYNEEKNIERSLQSIRWADELIVVDSFSTDSTVEIARKFTDRILQAQYDGEVTQRERGFAVASGDWLFWIDADEEVSDELREELLKEINQPSAKDGYYVQRRVWALGKWIEHGGWFPDRQFRLVRKGKYVAEYQAIHGGFTTTGPKGSLIGFLNHYTYTSISEHLRKMNDQTSLHVSNKLKDNPSIDVGWQKIVLSPVSYFLRMFIVRRGYKDGRQGFLLAVYSALYTLLLYAKTWEHRWRVKEGKGILPPITNSEVQQLKRLL